MKYRRSTPNERVWDVPRSLQSFVAATQSVVLTADVFNFFKVRRSCPGSVGSPVPFSTLSSAIADDFHHESQEQRWSCATQEYYWLCSVCWFLRTSWSIVAGSKGKPNHSLLLPFLRTVLFVMLYTYSLLNSEPSSNIPIPKGVSSCTGAWLSAYLDFGTPPTL